MLMRICLIGAILLSLAVAIVNFVVVKDKITLLGNDRDKEKGLKVTAQNSLAATNKILVQVAGELKQTKTELASAISARDTAVATAAEQSKRADGLAQNLKSTEEKLADTANKLAAWESLGMPIATAKATLTSLRDMSNYVAVMETEKNVLHAQVVKLTNQIARMITPDDTGPALPDDLRGKILTVDPKYNFVIVNVGAKQGALLDGRLLISHNSVLVGEAIITGSIESNWCVANLMPGWDQANIREGDAVIAANIEK